MRKIIFRGKRVDNGKWVEGGFCYGGNKNEPRICPQYDFSAEVIPETVGEFTSLIDKNGKHIFEGDIVKVITPDHAIGFAIIGIGEIDGDGYKFIGVYGEIKGKRGEMVARAEECYEVIGNIHDNPELLKEVDEQ